MDAYYSDDLVQLYVGDMREVLPALGVAADCAVADPPYGETSLAWDHWPDGWLEIAAKATRSMWCFGSLRMYLGHAPEFKAAKWKLSQDVIREKQNGSGFTDDRFKRVHEQPTHWYHGPWSRIHHIAPRVAADADPEVSRHQGGSAVRSSDVHHGTIGAGRWTDDGTRIVRSVLRVRSMHHSAIHQTEKPSGILSPLIEYACPPGGLVLDPFAGSGSTLDVARQSGRRAIGIELYEPHAEVAAKRLSQMVLEAS